MEGSPNQYTVPIKEHGRVIDPDEYLARYAEMADFLIDIETLGEAA